MACSLSESSTGLMRPVLDLGRHDCNAPFAPEWKLAFVLLLGSSEKLCERKHYQPTTSLGFPHAISCISARTPQEGEWNCPIAVCLSLVQATEDQFCYPFQPNVF